MERVEVVCGKGAEKSFDLDVKWKHKHWQWQKVQSVGNDLFRGKTCVEWAQVEGSDIMYGAEEARWVGDAEMEKEVEQDVLE